MRECSTCGEVKELTEFYRNARFKDGYTTYCKECHQSKARTRYANNPGHRERLTRRQRLRLYGLTPESFDRLMDSQDGLCAICFTDLDELKPQEINVDHCHDTGKVRGILCNLCNLGLGSFRDSITNLTRAIAYLEVK